ncbi:sensor histidine kinase [Rhizohabitans arisaemae]|uniref:sensor histidine kinase n=1 Tax=Rhizohabitans arisaemae TaxID=2720610 RepID=UPI0024B17F2C|nr:histidine kinase [Rhizohabitans arisaemae]
MRRPEYQTLLPAGLLDGPRHGGRVRRSTRDWLVDILCFLFAVGAGLAIAQDVANSPTMTGGRLLVEQIVGGLACVALWFRRRWPAALGLVSVPVTLVSDLAAGAVMVLVFTVAVHRPFRWVLVIGGLHIVTVVPYLVLRPDPATPIWMTVLIGTLIIAVVSVWGMLVRARRELVHSLRERTVRAESEAALRVERARQLERQRIAREMHDVLAHRISLLSLHAGALEFRPDAPSEEIARAAGAIRTSAHQALQDLREVIGVLRGPYGQPDGTPERPQPKLADLPALIEESREAGAEVTFDITLEDLGSVPEGLGRNIYRIAQEGLTNARKHAQGRQVRVTVAGSPGTGLAVEIRNHLPSGGVTEIPGTGTGLIGLKERADLVGGSLEHGPTLGGEFRLRAWLPWSA